MRRRPTRRTSMVLLAAILVAGCGGSEADRGPATTETEEPGAVPADFPAGTYEATITDENGTFRSSILGEWTLQLTDSGRWSLRGLSDTGRYMSTGGDYAVSGDELTILTDVVCGPGQAVFGWSFDGDALKLDPVREECQAIRTAHLTAKPWSKVR